MSAAPPKPKLAIVLSGGGARGAYEAGVLSYILDELPKHLGRPATFSIVTGTSIGAIHACFLAATAGRERAGARLVELWRALSLAEVYHVGPGDVFRLPMWLIGGQSSFAAGSIEAIAPNAAMRLPGLLDTGPLEEIVASQVDWARIHRQIEAGVLDALAVTTTEIATGRSVVFVDSRDRDRDTNGDRDTDTDNKDNGAVSSPIGAWEADPFVVGRRARIGANHALASAAIPILFPARRIDGAFHCDGGLRLNTPLLPALRLGATRVLVIGLRHRPSPEEEDRRARGREGSFLSPSYLTGKVLNALLLDRVEWDLMQLRLANGTLLAGEAEFGPDFLERLNRMAAPIRPSPLRVVEDCYVSPSEDVGEIAGRCLERMGPSKGVRDRVIGLVMRIAARGTGADKDLLSYLLFDRAYTEILLDLGRKDAESAHEDLVRIFS